MTIWDYADKHPKLFWIAFWIVVSWTGLFFADVLARFPRRTK